jgi:transposase
MSLKPQPIPPVPTETVRVVQAAFPKGNVYMQMRDGLGSIYTDEIFADLYPADGQPSLSPWRLALVTIMQFAENLSDRQAADAVRARMDWKYALSLELEDSGFHYSVLSEFRTRLVENEAAQRLLDEILTVFREKEWLRARGQQRTDSTHVLAAVRELNHLEIVGETLRHALNTLASVVPGWLKAQVPSEWYERYGERFDEYRLSKNKAERQALVEQIGQDGWYLLEQIYADKELGWLREVPAVEMLRQVWVQQYWLDNGQLKRREVKNMPPVSDWIRSPFDLEARYGKKRSDRHWVGYKVHVTETCDEDLPHLITQVETRPAYEQDHAATLDIQRQLTDADLCPDEHLVDAGYVNANIILCSQAEHDVTIVGPVNPDPSWQAHTPGAYDISQFRVDWEAQTVTCPEGHQNQRWYPSEDSQGEPVVQVHFASSVCQFCPNREQCTRAKKSGRTMVLRADGRHEALQEARQYQKTDEFKEKYRLRSGAEGTLSQSVRNSGLRRTRYIGLEKTHLQHVATAVATNILRAVNWLNGLPLAATRQSRFAALAA